MTVQIIYYSKYGSTREIAEAIGRKLQTDRVCDVRELKKITGDLLVIGSAIYSEIIHKDETVTKHQFTIVLKIDPCLSPEESVPTHHVVVTLNYTKFFPDGATDPFRR
jgi:menaquinone-dependent protoporphyrinogen IX oxidase